MTAPRDPDRLIRAFLAEGPTELPGRAYDAVRSSVDLTHQRAVLGPWREPRMSRYAQIAVAAAVVLVVAVLVVNLVTTPNGGVGSPGNGASPTPSPAVPGVGYGPVEPGTRAIDIRLHRYDDKGVAVPFASTTQVVFAVPDGWTSIGWGITKGGARPPGGLSMTAWAIDRVFIDPCHWQTPGDFADPPFMRRLDGLAESLWDWWGATGAPFQRAPTAPTSTQPVKVTLGGLEARYVEVTAPSDIDFADCDGGEYRVWLDAAGSERYLQGPGEIDRVWIVDVNGPIQGGLLVIDASFFPGTSAQDRADLQAIVDSIQIGPITGEPGTSDGPTPVPTD